MQCTNTQQTYLLILRDVQGCVFFKIRKKQECLYPKLDSPPRQNRLPRHHTSHVPVLDMPVSISPVFIIESCSLPLFRNPSDCSRCHGRSGKTGSTTTAIFEKLALVKSKISKPIQISESTCRAIGRTQQTIRTCPGIPSRRP